MRDAESARPHRHSVRVRTCSRLPARRRCVLTRELTQRDDASLEAAADIRRWLRRVAVHPEPACRREVARALDLTASGPPIRKIAGRLAVRLADDEDAEVRRAVAEALYQQVGMPGDEPWGGLQDWIAGDQIAEIIRRLCERGPGCEDDRYWLLCLVKEGAAILCAAGSLDELILGLVAPLIAGTSDDQDSLIGLAGDLCWIAHLLDVRTLWIIVPFVANHLDPEVRDTWELSHDRDMYGDARAVLEARLARARSAAGG